MPRVLIHGDPVSRFWAKVDKGDGCWEWIGQRGRYPAFCVKGRNTHAHRFSWELHHGPIPPGLFVCHRCDNPRCVRPEHLFLGTPADNARDMTEKGRRVRGAKHGMAKLTEGAVAEIRTSTGRRSASLLAEKFGVTAALIRMVRRGDLWAVAEVKP